MDVRLLSGIRVSPGSPFLSRVGFLEKRRKMAQIECKSGFSDNSVVFSSLYCLLKDTFPPFSCGRPKNLLVKASLPPCQSHLLLLPMQIPSQHCLCLRLQKLHPKPQVSSLRTKGCYLSQRTRSLLLPIS